MLSTLTSGSVPTANKSRQTNSFERRPPTTSNDSRVIQCKGFCALIKRPSVNDKEVGRHSSPESESLLDQFVTDNDKKTKNSKEKEQINYKNFQDLSEDVPDSKHTSEVVNFNAGSENIFDENFDLDEFMFVQNPNSISSIDVEQNHSENLLLGLQCNSGTTLHPGSTENNFPPTGFISNELETNRFSADVPGNSNYLSSANSSSSKNSSDNLQRHGNSKNWSYSNAHNDAFIHTLDSKRLSSSMPQIGDSYDGREFGFVSDPAGLEQEYSRSTFHMFGKRENVPALANRPDNPFSTKSFSSSPYLNVIEQELIDSDGRFSELQAHTSLNNHWVSNGSNCSTTNDSELKENQHFSNSPESRTNSHDTDASNPADARSDPAPSADPSSTTSNPDSKNSSKKTAYNEKWGVKVFKAWCVDNRVPDEFEKLTAEKLNDLLTKFWQSIRKSNGDYYGRNSLFNLRAMINKHLKGGPFSVSFDIVTDDRFRLSNECLDEQLKHLKGIGRTIAHKVPISSSDIQALYNSNVLSMATPISLLRKVWFEITLHFCPKGGESQEKIKKCTFKIFRDETGRRYVARSLVKRQEGGKTEARMYDTNGPLCPVKSFEFYLSKLHPMQPRLFQQPRKKSNPSSPTWYGKSPIGEKALQQMMANISIEANLSKRYTNHCVRTTALQQFTDLQKNYESAEHPHADSQTSSRRVCVGKNRHVISGTHPHLNRLDESVMHPCFTADVNGPSSSLNTTMYHHPPTLEATSLDCLNNGAHLNVDALRRQADSTPPGGAFQPALCKQNMGSTKRRYVSEVPFFPPPSYNEHCFQRPQEANSAKRMRTDEGTDFFYPLPDTEPKTLFSSSIPTSAHFNF